MPTQEQVDASLAMQKRIQEELSAAIKVDHFSIRDTSGNCGSSFEVIIVSPDFEKKMTLARHKLVNQILSEEISQLHAFSQKTFTPSQWVIEQAKNPA
ncbi:hypothetical protein TREMEDRAFT_32184 [Tremella mesenterica DSM 1558]|uniref:uncharacterized protein n=1 Tax=Tremella mesenterica (strain ATCC 24925 / CBS 8224 / DSM 1558 / NBRC 9311 / NRRL Y-6157 / RJB 2259-6 / UBC 559-6) TaxID=578456 RepID=UPI0003F4975E|nr:uncharacterized protein TREMEDRAFT_32184 [Tremella mesenterica DSM 1558]EIW68365.1 hypothetical protein TREMEDRAFT_32184 [Tremella mesenterica DSM 1558]